MVPQLRLTEEGALVHLTGEKKNETYIGKYGVLTVSDIAYSDVKFEDYDRLEDRMDKNK